jgi:hypothetical protein
MIKSNIILSIEFVEKYDSLTDKELLDATNKCNSGEYLDIVIYFHKLWNIDITTTNMFEIGKKIKCINTKNKYGEIVAEELNIGEKYQILSTTIINNYDFSSNEYFHIRLKEFGEDVMFPCNIFTPIV